MSCTVTGLHWSGQTGSREKSGKRTWTTVHVVTATDAEDGPAAVLNAPGLPLPGLSSYSAGNDSDPQAICESQTPSRADGRLVWHVTSQFSTQPADDKKRDEDGEPENDPFKWADQIELSGAKYTRPVDRATYRGGLKGDSAGRRKPGTKDVPRDSCDVAFVPQPDRDDTRLVLRITKFKKTFPTTHWLNYRDAINSDTWTYGKSKLGFSKTFEKYQCKLEPIVGTMKIEGNIRYWEVTYEIHAVDYEATGGHGWRYGILDQGYFVGARNGDPDGHGGELSLSDELRAREAGNPPIRRQLDRDGQPVDALVLLDGDGHQLTDGSEPVYLEYSVYNEKPFSALGL